ncbi:MAG: 30S ribosome-binding factor RbfA [Puniceicoccales bacterium]|jgi:ribosome-binding factor A|nr:30S ribosome-binding factor RbfA [Puniceicoccales bacterium]
MNLRTQKISELIRQEMGNILRQDFCDEAKTITITNAIIADDLRYCRITYVALGHKNFEKIAAGFFKRNSGKIKRKLVKNINIKHFPELSFELDKSLEKGNHVLKILDGIE